MPDTTPTYRPADSYFPTPIPAGPSEPARLSRAVPVGGLPSAAVEASRLVLDAEQLLQDSRAAEAEPLLLRALTLYERADNTSPACIPVLGNLAAIAMTRGDLAAAESHLQRALALATEQLGTDHPEVATILGGLARLYLRRSEFTRAEPLLQRLLEIKRARGEDHPEVATVLASLATVHSAMGAHESAERILRCALTIREKTLAPNHFATVTTLEHLAEACTARGKFDEALRLLHRALGHRQRALGVAHPSIAAARTRIADLELLSSNETLSSAVTSDAVPEHDVPLEVPASFELSPPERAVPVTEPPTPTTYEDSYEEWEDEVGEERPTRLMLARLDDTVARVTTFARTPRGRLAALALGVTSLLAAFVLWAQLPGDAPVNAARASTMPSPSRVSTSPTASSDAAVTPEVVAPRASVPSIHLTRPPEGRRPTSVRRPDRSASDETRGTTDAEFIPLPTAPKVRGLEPLVAGGPTASVAAPLVAPTDFTTSGASLTERATASGRRLTVRATLPPGNPAPEYPPDLMRRGIEGRVMAEFLVDTKGRVDGRSLRIISSTDERFTQAVRAVIPNLRFLPAELDGVKTEEWVAMPFRFSPTSK